MLIGVLVVIAAGLVFYGCVQDENRRKRERDAARGHPPPELEPEPEPEHWLDRWKAAQRIHRD
jgi:hypothetical protein